VIVAKGCKYDGGAIGSSGFLLPPRLFSRHAGGASRVHDGRTRMSQRDDSLCNGDDHNSVERTMRLFLFSIPGAGFFTDVRTGDGAGISDLDFWLVHCGLRGLHRT
jgi:hypothetical protein